MQIDYFINSEHFSPITPRFSGEEKCEPNHNYGPVVREYYILHFVVSGKGFFQNESEAFHLKENDCFIIRPQELTFYQAHSRDPWFYIWIAFEESYLIPDVIRQGGVLRDTSLREFFLSLASVRGVSLHPGAYLCGKLFELFQILQTKKEQSSYIQQSIMMMESSLTNPLSISDIAARLHIDRSHFSTLFRKETGMSPQQYYLNLRFSQAEILLQEYDFTVTQAAHATGFQSLANFSRMYKKHRGAAPTLCTKKD